VHLSGCHALEGEKVGSNKGSGEGSSQPETSLAIDYVRIEAK
jgi:hypothetical protein